MRAASFLIALVCASVIAVTATSATTCGYAGYDFSSLTASDLTFSDATYDYFIRPCGVVSQASCLAASPSASACQVQYNPAGASWITALNSNIKWGLLPDNQGAFYNETGLQSCWATGSPTDYFTNVEFVCATTTSVSVTMNLCTQTYQINTPLACVTPPSPSSGCGFNGLDFSSLMGTDIQGTDGGSVYTYYLSVCGTLKSQPTCTSVVANAAACQEQVNPKGQSFVDGLWQGFPSASWYFIDPSNPSKGVGYSMVGTQSCWASGSPTDYYSNVNFVCSEESQPMTVIVPPLSCTLNYTIYTPLACGSQPPPPPPPTTNCGYNGMDFSSLKGKDLVGSDGGTTYQYYLSVCGALTSHPACTAIQSTCSACQSQDSI